MGFADRAAVANSIARCPLLVNSTAYGGLFPPSTGDIGGILYSCIIPSDIFVGRVPTILWGSADNFVGRGLWVNFSKCANWVSLVLSAPARPSAPANRAEPFSNSYILLHSIFQIISDCRFSAPKFSSNFPVTLPRFP